MCTRTGGCRSIGGLPAMVAGLQCKYFSFKFKGKTVLKKKKKRV